MANSHGDLTQTPASDPWKLAEPVIQGVEVKNLFLGEGGFHRFPGASFLQDIKRNEITKIEIGSPSDDKRFFLKIHFEFEGRNRISPDQREDAPATSSVKAVYIITYNIDHANSFTLEQLSAFAAINGAHHAWPYWREFVQASMTRMSLAPVMISVYRVEEALKGFASE